MVCSQIAILVLYVIGRIDDIEFAMKGDAQNLYRILTNGDVRDVTEITDYTPPLEASMFRLSICD